MFREFREWFFNMITSRLFVLFVLFLALSGVLVYRIFELQIIDGAEYLDKFELKINRDISIPATRGVIYDRNGELLAYNELAYSVTIEDVYESGKGKNKLINETIYKLIHMVESCGDQLINDFNIILNDDGQFEFAVSNTQLIRFLADIYGKADSNDLGYAERTSSAKEVIDFLATKYGIGEYTDPEDKKSFVVGMGYTDEELLKMITVRYALSLNNYQKYITTTVATDVSDKTVAVIMENSDQLDGVSIAETTIRRYVDSVYFSHILGYTGDISEDEYAELSVKNESYTRNSTVGKAGIEQELELKLQGKAGVKNVYLNNLGKIIEVNSQTDPIAGYDVHLTIDKNLQKAVYNLLEQKIAGILVDKIDNIKEYVHPENASASNIRIPIDDVYFALINNSVINVNHFQETTALEVEKQVYDSFLGKRQQEIDRIKEELTTNHTNYNQLSDELKDYQSYIVSMLVDDGVIDSSLIDKENEVYIAWRNETVSLNTYLNEVIAKNWIDTTKLAVESKYLNAEEIYASLLVYIENDLLSNNTFFKKIYQYMIKDNSLTGKQICQLLYEQKIIETTDEERDGLESGRTSPYHFMMERIRTLDITPAQLALDPCSGSIVVTDVKNGDVLALVTYPSYDNNKLANTIDAKYYAKLNGDLSKPLWDYATQQRSAPGSTYKMISAIAGIEEQVVSRNEQIVCHGVWDVGFTTAKCWIAPSSHGALNITSGIANSCNAFFYEVGYRLARVNGNYNNDVGLANLNKYAQMFGLDDKSGVEIVEEEPKLSDTDAVRSAIGQGTNNFTTVGLARYVTTVANSGTCYDLTLLDYLSDSNGNVVETYDANVRNQVDIASSTWSVVHTGMKQVVEKKAYFQDFGMEFAGKTGTAQESRLRSNHALFVGYAPYDDPEIAFATRIAFGYASDYAAQLTGDVLKYYYELEDEENLLNGTATITQGAVSREN